MWVSGRHERIYTASLSARGSALMNVLPSSLLEILEVTLKSFSLASLTDHLQRDMSRDKRPSPGKPLLDQGGPIGSVSKLNAMKVRCFKLS